jgi:ubiquinone/menaquinone biosynthesis C-methylase UbiE
MPKSKSRHKPKLPVQRYLCEAEVVTGLKSLAVEELRTRFGERVQIYDKAKPEEILFHYEGELSALMTLTKPVAIYLVQHYPIPRPLALLGHQHFQNILKQIAAVRALYPDGTFHSFRIGAAGRNSSVFTRVKGELQQATGLIPNEEEADLFLRVRKSDWQAEGWDVLVRLSPRPLSARSWRVCNWEGALNATIASAMIEMSDPRSDDRFFNLMCGSGTLLVERLLRASADVIGGCDTDLMALRCAGDNLRAAGFADQVELLEMDATNLELPDACIDVICADLPWGQLVGSHEGNLKLYPLILLEATRIAAPGARAVFITHEIKLMDKMLLDYTNQWSVKSVTRVFQGGLHPKIYALERR